MMIPSHFDPRLIRQLLAAAGVTVLLAGCGGGGGGGSAAGPAAGNPPPAASPSAGGIWDARTSNGASASFYITEDGRLWSVTPIDALAAGIAFGSGAVSLDANNRVSGGYEAKGILPDPVSAIPGVLTCDLAGTVNPRATLQVDLGCSDSNGPILDESLTFFSRPGYDQDSDLATIAGNYTLAQLAGTNTLNIAGDGTVFGMFNNGPNCTVNGQVALIDPDYNLYDVSWTLSSCIVAVFQDYEGAQFTGVASMITEPGQPAGSFYLLMTGNVDGQLRSISLIYEPT